MTDREKLIDLLNKSFEGQYGKRGLLTAQHTATDLLANGVTFATDKNDGGKWVPASDPPKEPNEYIVMIKGGGSATALLYDGEKWFEAQGNEQVCYHVTHWMPLSEPPKGD